ncbi:sensor domain-containing diguanylate cyclase [Pseudidiomarina sp.]|uniref:sensor domain-containing diguanylate cyclase n=1 Tax=Pseudidiomarina sp. TaxID=2081707 RepID=UPI00299F0BEA|nr:sensor domain-containing diguanylate cyclase [Pseudidiomarina sp.]MDX1705021.1 sensor domain-containing diguanylate cyclase [Pseudidiomarina sp.]
MLISAISAQLINCSIEDTQFYIEQALAALGHGDRKDRCYVFLFNDDHSTMSNTHEWTNSNISAHKDELQDIPASAMPWFFEQMLSNGLVTVSELSDLPSAAAGFRAELEHERIKSMMAVGMYLEKKLIGFVGCDLVNRQCKWTENDVHQMRLVADMITNTIARHNTEKRLRAAEAELRQANARLVQLAREDGLTGLVNRRGLDEALTQELGRAIRNQSRLTLFMVDVDHFKAFNDRRGHVAGDAALKAVAKVLATTFQRGSEVVARYGGDEFFIISPELDPTEAAAQADRVLGRIRDLSKKEAITQAITVSVGIATVIPDRGYHVDMLMQLVDKAVYQAKDQGRDRHVIQAN